MLILACFVLAFAIATVIEIDSGTGGRLRRWAVTLCVLWTVMFGATADDEAALYGFVAYMLVALAMFYTVDFVGLVINWLRARFGTWHDVET